jgi:hypothetical protein
MGSGASPAKLHERGFVASLVMHIVMVAAAQKDCVAALACYIAYPLQHHGQKQHRLRDLNVDAP